MLFQRHFYLSILIGLRCTVASAQLASESIAEHVQSPHVEAAVSFASFRNEPASDDTAELEARVQRLEAE